MLLRHILIAALAAASLAAQDTTNFGVIGQIHRLDPAFDKLIPPDAKLEILAAGFDWAEGPVWHKEGGYLLFSDIPRNSVMKWEEGKGVSLWMKPSGYTGVVDYGAEPGSNGLAWHPERNTIVFCEHGDRRISILTPNGGKMTLADNYQGRRLNSPNDGTFKSNGDFYFTDPPYGLPERENDQRRELDVFGVYRLTSKGELMLLTDEMTRPNGIAFSPDEKTLYVAQSDPKAAVWKKFPVNMDGSLGDGEILYDATDQVDKLPGLPDGLKVDAAGNLFATGPGGVYVFSAEGKLLGRLETGERTANVAWGGDGSTLYITADMYLLRVKTTAKGAGW